MVACLCVHSGMKYEKMVLFCSRALYFPTRDLSGCMKQFKSIKRMFPDPHHYSYLSLIFTNLRVVWVTIVRYRIIIMSHKHKTLIISYPFVCVWTGPVLSRVCKTEKGPKKRKVKIIKKREMTAPISQREKEMERKWWRQIKSSGTERPCLMHAERPMLDRDSGHAN